MVSELVGEILGGVGGVDEHIWVPTVDRVGVVEFCESQLESQAGILHDLYLRRAVASPPVS